MGLIDSGNWRTARAGGTGLLHLAVSLLLLVALTASHGLASPHRPFYQHGIGSSSHGDPLDPGYSNIIESVSHARSRVGVKNVNPWRRESAQPYASQSSPYLAAVLLRIEPPTRHWRVVRHSAATLPGGPLPRIYDPQGPPPVRA